MHDKIFISYAKEDYQFASKLYDFLTENNFSPFLDKKNILPGQDWNFVIKKALREANYIILLLSITSIQKRGYVQKEFKTALDFVDEKLEDDIYLIPLKINDCIVPDKLSRFQWIEYDSSDCFNLILSSLRLQRAKYLEEERKLIMAKEIFAYREFCENFEYGDKIRILMSSKFFQFNNEENINLKHLNAIIKGEHASYIAYGRKHFFTISGEVINMDNERMNWIYEISDTPNLITKHIISVNRSTYRYSGGAHGHGFINGHNFHLNPFFEIRLEEFFDLIDYKSVLDFISNFCCQELRKIYNEIMNLSAEENDTIDTKFNLSR